jgi:hypothetical protein
LSSSPEVVSIPHGGRVYCEVPDRFLSAQLEYVSLSGFYGSDLVRSPYRSRVHLLVHYTLLSNMNTCSFWSLGFLVVLDLDPGCSVLRTKMIQIAVRVHWGAMVLRLQHNKSDIYLHQRLSVLSLAKQSCYRPSGCGLRTPAIQPKGDWEFSTSYKEVAP